MHCTVVGGGSAVKGTHGRKRSLCLRLCYLDTVDGEHEAVLHDPGHGSSQHVGASGGTLWQTLIVWLRVLCVCVRRAADNINSLYIRLPGDSRRQAPHDAFGNSPETSPEPSNFCPGRCASNPGIIACTLCCHPTPPHKSIRFHEKPSGCGEVFGCAESCGCLFRRKTFAFRWGGFWAPCLLLHALPASALWQAEPRDAGRSGQTHRAPPTSGRENNVFSDWLLWPSPTHTIGRWRRHSGKLFRRRLQNSGMWHLTCCAAAL